MPATSRRSWPSTSAATAARRVSQSGIRAISGPGEYRLHSPGGSLLAITPERSPTRAPAGAGCNDVLPPSINSDPPSSARPPTRSAAISSASQPPRRWAWYASGVTGIVLSPAVVPAVLTHRRGRPGQVTWEAPASAASHEARRAR